MSWRDLNGLRSGKSRITIMLDNDVLENFRPRAEEQGTGYQTAIKPGTARVSPQTSNR